MITVNAVFLKIGAHVSGEVLSTPPAGRRHCPQQKRAMLPRNTDDCSKTKYMESALAAKAPSESAIFI